MDTENQFYFISMMTSNNYNNRIFLSQLSVKFIWESFSEVSWIKNTLLNNWLMPWMYISSAKVNTYSTCGAGRAPVHGQALFTVTFNLNGSERIFD